MRKFLQNKERGALFTDANYRSQQIPQLPAFNWIGFDSLQQIDDKFTKESVAYYDSAREVVIFVVLPSMVDNRIALWQRIVNIPNVVQLTFHGVIKLAMGDLRDREAKSTEMEEDPITMLRVYPDQPRPPLAHKRKPHITWIVTRTQSPKSPVDGALSRQNSLYQAGA